MDKKTVMNMEIVENIKFKNIGQPSPSIKLECKDKTLVDYYEKAGPDYEAWSPNFNMHFGYFKKGINPFNREKMLEAMTNRVLKELGAVLSGKLADFGCGLGTSLRFAKRKFPKLQLSGVTIVPWQVQKANELNLKTDNTEIEIDLCDYAHTNYENKSLDAVIAIESSCYAKGADKASLLEEIARVLKPRGRVVIADGFRNHGKPMLGIKGRIYRQLCSSWALSELGEINAFEQRLLRLGFEDIKITNISWRVAPSVAHVPLTVIKFLLKQLFFGKKKMNTERWNNLVSPLLTMAIGAMQKDFGYYLVSATKGN